VFCAPAALPIIGLWRLTAGAVALGIYAAALGPFVGIIEIPSICACFRT
jgi:hypothetical protein